MATTAMISSHFSIEPSLPSPLHPPHRHHSPLLPLPRRTTLAAPLLSSAAASPPPPPPPFLAPDDLAKLHLLQRFSYSSPLVDGGSLAVGLMGTGQIDPTVWLLADSFAESMLVPKRYVRFLAFLVRQYALEKQALLPFAATLVGVYRGKGKEEEELAGTVEISFDGRGANASPPTPVPPRDSPYICNMAVKQELRRYCPIYYGGFFFFFAGFW